MRLNNVMFTFAGLLAGVGLSLATVASPVSTASAQADAHAAAQKAQVMSTIYHLDKVGFHGLEDSTKAGTIPAGALGNVRRARIQMMATDWPDSMKDMATKLGGHMMELEEALRTEVAARAAGPATEVHEIEHDLSEAVYQMLSGNAPAPAPH